MSGGGQFGDLNMKVKAENETGRALEEVKEEVKEVREETEKLGQETEEVGRKSERSAEQGKTAFEGFGESVRTKVLGSVLALGEAVAALFDELESRAASAQTGFGAVVNIAERGNVDLNSALAFHTQFAEAGFDAFDALQIGVTLREQLLAGGEEAARVEQLLGAPAEELLRLPTTDLAERGRLAINDPAQGALFQLGDAETNIAVSTNIRSTGDVAYDLVQRGNVITPEHYVNYLNRGRYDAFTDVDQLFTDLDSVGGRTDRRGGLLGWVEAGARAFSDVGSGVAGTLTFNTIGDSGDLIEPIADLITGDTRAIDRRYFGTNVPNTSRSTVDNTTLPTITVRVEQGNIVAEVQDSELRGVIAKFGTEP